MNRRDFICLGVTGVAATLVLGAAAIPNVDHPINVRLGKLSQKLDASHGFCLRCKTTWSFVKGHVTNYDENHGCFPVCEKCWTELGTPEKRLPYYHQLVDQWIIAARSPEERAQASEKRVLIVKAVMDGK